MIETNLCRLEDVETTALRHGKKIIAKLEERLRFLEAELCKWNVYISNLKKSCNFIELSCKLKRVN